MTFKKDGTDPITTRPSRSWNGFNLVGAAILNALGLGVSDGGSQPEDEFRYRRSKRQADRPRRRRNMLHVSKRVRRKHRRAA
jgi:hypothetical protein